MQKLAHTVEIASFDVEMQGRSHRCGRCGHGRTTFRSTNARSKVTQVSFPYGTQTRLPDCIHTWSIMAVKPEDIGDLRFNRSTLPSLLGPRVRVLL